MSYLNPVLEYLLWFEEYQARWIATPIVREGDLILDIGYGEAVPLRFEGG